MLQKRYKVITKKNTTSIFLKKITTTRIFFFLSMSRLREKVGQISTEHTKIQTLINMFHSYVLKHKFLVFPIKRSDFLVKKPLFFFFFSASAR